MICHHYCHIVLTTCPTANTSSQSTLWSYVPKNILQRNQQVSICETLTRCPPSIPNHQRRFELYSSEWISILTSSILAHTFFDKYLWTHFWSDTTPKIATYPIHVQRSHSSQHNNLHTIAFFAKHQRKAYIMSNALRQNQRVNIREVNSNGNGNGNNGSDGGYDASLTYCVDLEPSSDEVMAELKSHVIMKVADKLAIGKDLLKHKDIIFNKLVSLGQQNLANLFIGALSKDLKGNRGKKTTILLLYSFA